MSKTDEYQHLNGPMWGEIEIHEKYNPLAGQVEQVEYKWQGGPKMQMSRELFYAMHKNKERSQLESGPGWPINLEGTRFRLGPYRLHVFEDQPPYFGDVNCIRLDYRFWRLHAYLPRILRHLDLIYRRLIITAVVWGMADYNPAVVPYYKDLYLYQWVVRLGKRIRREEQQDVEG